MYEFVERDAYILKNNACKKMEDVLSSLKATIEGLNQNEIKSRINQFGFNCLPTMKNKPIIFRFFDQFKNLFNILLLFAAFLSYLTGKIYDDFESYRMALVIVIVVFMSMFFSLFQEYRAEKAIKSLIYLIPNSVKVIRDKKLFQIQSEQLVPGDIIILDMGDKVPADIRLIDSDNLHVDNSILTGESEPIFREAIEKINESESDITEFKNLILAGTFISSGKARGLVLATGKNTQIARVVEIISETKQSESQIQNEVNRTAKINVVTAILIGVSFLMVALFVLKLELLSSIMFMIGVIISLVPEGLQVTITLALALSAIKLSKRKVLVKNLSAIHTLGTTTVICTDKTGTLTQNQMMVEKIWVNGEKFSIIGEGFNPNGKIKTIDGIEIDPAKNSSIIDLAECCVANADTNLTPPDSNSSRWKVIGDTTEAATFVFGLKMGIEKELILRKFPRIGYIPFDHEKKMTISLHQLSPFEGLLIIKGSFEKVIENSTHIIIDNQKVILTQDIKELIMQENQSFAKMGLRIIAFAKKNIDISSSIPDCNENINGLTFIGLTAISDPPRMEVFEAIKKARGAGIRVIMISGDYEITASAIAERIGLITNQQAIVLTGPKISKCTDEELLPLLKNEEVVCARMNPEQKLRIVRLLKEGGEIVTVTGDGVNDVPALHAANVGVSMGVAGTQVAIEKSQIVLMDDNFASIINGIEGGRSILDNLKKYMKYVFTHNWAQLIGFIVFVLFSIPLPITVLGILSIDLIMEIPPSFALILEHPEKTTMNRNPTKNTHLFSSQTLWQSMYIGIIIGIFSLFQALNAYIEGGWIFGMTVVPDSLAYARGMTLFLFGIMTGQLGNLLSCRQNSESILRMKIFSNKWLIYSVTIELAILFSIVYLPFLQSVFGTVPLTLFEVIKMFSLTFIIIFIEEIRKFIQKPKKNGIY